MALSSRFGIFLYSFYEVLDARVLGIVPGALDIVERIDPVVPAVVIDVEVYAHDGGEACLRDVERCKYGREFAAVEFDIALVHGVGAGEFFIVGDVGHVADGRIERRDDACDGGLHVAYEDVADIVGRIDREVDRNPGRLLDVAREDGGLGLSLTGVDGVEEVVDLLVVRDVRDDGRDVPELRFAVAGILFQDGLHCFLGRCTQFLRLGEVAVAEGGVDVDNALLGLLHFGLVVFVRDFFTAGDDVDLGLRGLFRGVPRLGERSAFGVGTACKHGERKRRRDGSILDFIHNVIS